MVIFCDIDGTLCTNTNGRGYERAKPFIKNIAKINKLYKNGTRIILWTSRGTTTGDNWEILTSQQLKDWGVSYHELRFGKPHYDLWIDDKAMNSENFFK